MTPTASLALAAAAIALVSMLASSVHQTLASGLLGSADVAALHVTGGPLSHPRMADIAIASR